MDIKKLFPFILFILFISVGHVVANDKSQRLQALLDAYSNTSATQLIIDLTAENVSGEIDETVYVRNRSNIKFVNGTLTSACLPMIEITDEGKLEVGNGVTIIGNGSGDIHIKGGTLIASVGSVMKLRNYAIQKHNRSKRPNSIPPEPYYMDKLITLLTDGSIFILDGGIINGGLAVKDKHVNVTIQSGKIETIQEENSNDDNIIGKPSVSINGGKVGLIGNYYYGSFNANLYVNGGYVDYIGTYGSVRVSGTAEVNELIQMPSDTDESPKCQFMGGRVHHAQTSYNAWIRGNVRVDSLCLPVKDTYLMCWGDLNHDICLGVMGRVEGDAIAKGLNTLTAFREVFDSTGAPDSFIKHQITESDKEHIKVYTNEETIDGKGLINYTTSNWQWCHEYPQSTTLKDNSIILKSTTQANEAYAVYTADGTLTFYYDAQRNSRAGTTYSLGGLGPNWNTYIIQKVVFTPSFADARPTTTSSWFAGTDGYPGEGLPSSISKIEGIEYLNTSKVTDMSQMFYKCHNLRSLDVSNFDTSNVTDMRYMFFGCSGLISLGISNFNTSNVTNIRSIFSGCSSLTSIDLSNFDTSKVTSMWGVFYGCNGLASLDVSHFDTSKVTDMGCMFKDCISLSTIYIGENWNIEKVTESSSMFNGCTNLVGGVGTKYDPNHVDISYAHIDGGPSNPGYLTDKNATSLMNLQEFIDANAGATSVVDVDLSKFENDLVREKTLNVSTGASYRFINGTLTRHSSLEGSILYVSEGSEVQIETNVAIGGDFPYLGYSGNPVITLNHGKLFVRGTVTAGHTMTTNVSSRSDVAIQMESDADDLGLYGGYINGPIVSKAKGRITLACGAINLQYGDDWSVSTYGDIDLNGLSIDGNQNTYSISSPLSINLLERQSRVLLNSALVSDISITCMQKQLNDIIVAGYKEDKTGISDGTFLYKITEEDLQKVKFIGSSSYSLCLEENAIYLKGLPNTGCDEEWLQKKLDEIASQKPSEPVELTICEDGITLTKNIKVAKDCKAVLTGGPITSAETIDYRGREGLFRVYGEIGFHDISLTFNNDAKGDRSIGYFWLDEGSLELNKGTIVSTNSGTVVGGYGKLDITDAVLFAGGEEMVISSDINTTISDYIELIGQQTYCNGKIAIDMKTNPETGYARSPIFRVNKVHVTSSLDLWAPMAYLRNVYLYKDAVINTYENGFMQMQITGEWNQMAVGSAFVTSASIGQTDYNNMTFVDMPIDRRAEFVPGNHQVRLMSTGQIDVQTCLSGLNYVSQPDPTTLYLNSDAVNTVYQPTTINHQNVTFDGMKNGATSRARLHFTKDQTLTIGKNGQLTLTNIDVTGEDGSVGFEVYGKIIISGNVHVSDLSYFLCIYSGGRVYASAGLRSPISIQFANGLASGSTVIAGTGGYQLTETDLTYVTVEGCELQLDKANNRIIALNGTGIETINDNPGTMSQEGVYDLGGRKVVPTHQGVYIIREGKVARKVYVK